MVGELGMLDCLKPQEIGLVGAVAELPRQRQGMVGGPEGLAKIPHACQDRTQIGQDALFAEAIAGFPGISKCLSQDFYRPCRLTRPQQAAIPRMP